MQRDELKSIIENILLAADQPVHVGELEKIFINSSIPSSIVIFASVIASLIKLLISSIFTLTIYYFSL